MIGTIITFLGINSKINWSRLIVVGAVILSIGGTVYSGYRYVDRLHQENQTLIANNATLQANNVQLEQAVETQRDAIASLEADIKKSQQIQQETFDDFETARNRVQELESRLGRHELGFLASRRPGLVEDVVNAATSEIGRCLEIASGSPLTQAEINATLPSEINSECPDLANPSFIGEQD